MPEHSTLHTEPDAHAPAPEFAPHPAGEHGNGHQEHHAEHPTLQVYYNTFAGLMVLLLMTLGAAMIDLGPLNVVFALAIAWSKVFLIVTYFMHLKYTSPLSRVFAGSGFVFLAILFVFAFADYLTRIWMPR